MARLGGHSCRAAIRPNPGPRDRAIRLSLLDRTILMTTLLTSVARVQAGLAAIVEMIAGPGRIDIKVIARPQSVTRPYRVHIPSSIRRELYQFLGQLPQFKVLPHETEPLALTYEQAEKVVLISWQAAERAAALEYA